MRISAVATDAVQRANSLDRVPRAGAQGQRATDEAYFVLGQLELLAGDSLLRAVTPGPWHSVVERWNPFVVPATYIVTSKYDG